MQVKKRHWEAIGMWQAARGFKAQSLLAAIYRKPGSLAIKLPGFPITEKSTAPQPRQPVAKVFKPIPNSFRPPPGGAHEEPQLSTTYIHNKKNWLENISNQSLLVAEARLELTTFGL